MWPSVESTCHSTLQAPAVSVGTVALSRSAAPSLTTMVTGLGAPRSSSRRIVDSLFSIRLLKRSEIWAGGAFSVEPAEGDDSSSSE